MAKAPFRFFRGELNGYYIRAFLLCRNAAVQDIVDELIYHATKRWKLESEVGSGESAIRFDEMLGIAAYAGVIQPIQYIENTNGSIRFSSSTVVGGVQRSERGLFDIDNESFEYVRTGQDDYPTDIVTDASSQKRSTLVPSGATPEGYVEAGTTVFNPDGSIVEGSILSTPPSSAPYTEYHGNKYLFFEETFESPVEMNEEVFKAYFECVMRMRRYGESVAELLRVTGILCVDYVTDLAIAYVGPHYTLTYTVNNGSDVDNKSGRMAAWVSVVQKRFKDFVLVERA